MNAIMPENERVMDYGRSRVICNVYMYARARASFPRIIVNKKRALSCACRVDKAVHNRAVTGRDRARNKRVTRWTN